MKSDDIATDGQITWLLGVLERNYDPPMESIVTVMALKELQRLRLSSEPGELQRVNETADKLWKLCVDEGFPWGDGSTQDKLTELGLLYPKDMTAEDESERCTNCDDDCHTCYRAVEHVRDAKPPETKVGG